MNEVKGTSNNGVILGLESIEKAKMKTRDVVVRVSFFFVFGSLRCMYREHA